MATPKCKRGTKKGTRSCKRKPGPKKSSRKCKRGRKKKSRSCKGKPGPKKSKRKSRYRMSAIRTDQNIQDKILEAANNPTKDNLNALSGLQLNQICKLRGISKCNSKNKLAKVNYLLKKLDAKGNPFGITPMVTQMDIDTLVGVGMPDKVREAMNDHGSGSLSKESLKDMNLDELKHFCKMTSEMGWPYSGCTTRSKSRTIRHILRKLSPGGGVVVSPPPRALAAPEIEGMSGDKLRALCKNLNLGNCTSEDGKRLSTRQQRDKLLLHYRHAPVSKAELKGADSHNLKKMCRRFGVKNCTSQGGVKTSDADVRNMLMSTGNVF
jgi:hypothetical protein